MTTEFTAPVQIIVDTEQLLDQIGWRKTSYDYEVGAYEETGPADIRRDLATEVAKILARKLRDEMKAVVRDVVAEVARAQVADIITETMATGFRKTNGYGEAVGEPITLREMVVNEVKGQLEMRVDEYGRKSDRYSGSHLTFVEFHARSAAQAALKGELGEAVTAAVAEIKGGVQDLVSKELAERIAKAATR